MMSKSVQNNFIKIISGTSKQVNADYVMDDDYMNRIDGNFKTWLSTLCKLVAIYPKYEGDLPCSLP